MKPFISFALVFVVLLSTAFCVDPRVTARDDLLLRDEHGVPRIIPRDEVFKRRMTKAQQKECLRNEITRLQAGIGPSDNPHRFKLKQLLSLGSYGAAYLASDGNDDVVVKVLRKEVGNRRPKPFCDLAVSRSETVKNEFFVHMLLDRVFKSQEQAKPFEQYFVKYIASWDDDADERSYLVLEYCNQGDLWEYRKTLTTFEERKAVIREAMKQIATGLEFLHRIHYYHLDLKPDNILVMKKSDGTIEYKLADFGFMTDLEYSDPYPGFPYPYWPPEKNHPGPPDEDGAMDLVNNQKADAWGLGATMMVLIAKEYQPLFNTITQYTSGPCTSDFLKAVAQQIPADNDVFKILNFRDDNILTAVSYLLHKNPDLRSLGSFKWALGVPGMVWDA